MRFHRFLIAVLRNGALAHPPTYLIFLLYLLQGIAVNVISDPLHRPWRQRRLPNFDYSDPDHAYFVTVCARHGTAPFTDARLATRVIDSLGWLRLNRAILLYAYCLMPDHLHLLLRLTSRQWNLGDIVGSFKKFSTKQSWALGFTGHLWQDRFYDHIVRKGEDGHQIAAYIEHNPVRKGLVAVATEYALSGFPDPM